MLCPFYTETKFHTQKKTQQLKALKQLITVRVKFIRELGHIKRFISMSLSLLIFHKFHFRRAHISSSILSLLTSFFDYKKKKTHEFRHTNKHSHHLSLIYDDFSYNFHFCLFVFYFVFFFITEWHAFAYIHNVRQKFTLMASV